MAVKIVTDSTADLPPELARELDITVVPLNVHFGEETFLDGIDLDADVFFQRAYDGAAPAHHIPALARCLPGGIS